jgi:pentose-5-phosphate-3-epimerase
MTNDPFEFIQKIDNSDYTYFIDIDHIQKYKDHFDQFSQFNIGFTILIGSSTKQIDEAVEIGNELMFLCVEEPGLSGQVFSENSYKLIDYVKKKNLNSKVTIDGGVDLEVVKSTTFNNYVSASHILTSLHPIGKIFELRYAKKYEI